VIETLLAFGLDPNPPDFIAPRPEPRLISYFPCRGRSGGPIGIKRGLYPGIDKGFHQAQADIWPTDSFVVYSGTERFPLAASIEVIGLREMAEIVAEHSQRP